MTKSPKGGTSGPPRLEVKPLTRHFQSGEAYERLPDVERQIGEALGLDSRALMERLKEHDEKSPGFLKEECLVYLIREYCRRDDDFVFNELSTALANRCLRHIQFYARRFVDRNLLDDCASEILSTAFEQILDFDSDRGDYIQVRFWHFLKRLEGDITKKYSRDRKKDQLTDSYDAQDEGEDGPRLDKDKVTRDITISPEKRLLLREGLLLLPEPIRTAFILHHYEGWQIESNDPQAPTIAKHFRKTPRTIRNWMAQAEDVLENWRGRNYD